MACLIRVPTEVVKSRAQTAAYGKDVGTYGAAVKLMQIEGLRGFYRGFGITLARDVSQPLFTFGTAANPVPADPIHGHSVSALRKTQITNVDPLPAKPA